MLRLLRTTIIGGIVFLVPIVVLIVVIDKALQITGALAAPLMSVLPDTVGRLAIAQVVAALILLLVCFAAGLVARTRLAQLFIEALERNILSNVPAYALLKTKTQSILSPDDIEDMVPVIVRFDDSWQFAFEVERIGDARVAVFLPGAPDAWTGSLCVVDAERVSPLDQSIPFVARMAKRLGKGAGQAIGNRRLDPGGSGQSRSRSDAIA